MKRFLPMLLCAALLLSGCGDQPSATSSSAPDSLVAQDGAAYHTQTEPPGAVCLGIYPTYSVHPTLSENRANLTLAPLLYEPLFWVDGQFQAVPVLCQSYAVSEDGLSWTFTLHGGITFSDGTPLTAQVVAAALELARQPASRYAQRLQDVTSISGEGITLTVTLSRPNGAFPLLLDIPIAAGNADRPPGTGPYLLSAQGDALTLQARADWWQQLPVPAQQISLAAVAKTDELVAAFDSGEVSLVDVDLMGTNSLGYSGSYETWDYSTTDLIYLGFNTQSGPCRSAAVRLALAQAIDRNAIVQTDFALHAVPCTLPVHPSSPLYDDTLAQPLRHAPGALAEAADELGLTNRALVLLVNSENSAKVGAARRIAAELERAGLSVTLQKLSFEDYLSALERRAFDLYLGEVVLTADFDLSALLGSGGTLNYGGWRDGQWDTLLSALREADDQQRPQAAAELLDYFNTQAPIAPICFKSGSVLTQWGRLAGLAPLRGNVFSRLESWRIQ